MFSLRNLAGKCFWEEMGLPLKHFFFFFIFIFFAQVNSYQPLPALCVSQVALSSNYRPTAETWQVQELISSHEFLELALTLSLVHITSLEKN
jgi:hypothetical protein